MHFGASKLAADIQSIYIELTMTQVKRIKNYLSLSFSPPDSGAYYFFHFVCVWWPLAHSQLNANFGIASQSQMPATCHSDQKPKLCERKTKVETVLQHAASVWPVPCYAIHRLWQPYHDLSRPHTRFAPSNAPPNKTILCEMLEIAKPKFGWNNRARASSIHTHTQFHIESRPQRAEHLCK